MSEPFFFALQSASDTMDPELLQTVDTALLMLATDAAERKHQEELKKASKV